MSAKSGENLNNMFNYIVDGFFEFKYNLQNLKESSINSSRFHKKAKKKPRKEGCC